MSSKSSLDKSNPNSAFSFAIFKIAFNQAVPLSSNTASLITSFEQLANDVINLLKKQIALLLLLNYNKNNWEGE